MADYKKQASAGCSCGDMSGHTHANKNYDKHAEQNQHKGKKEVRDERHEEKK